MPKLQIPAVILIAAALSSIACATSWPVHPGDSVSLDDHQGLLVVHVRTNVPIRILKIGGIRAAEDVPVGSHLRVIGATRGNYHWSDLEIAEGRLWFKDAEKLRFRVEPGVINYPGMIEVTRNGPFEVYMGSIDRSAMALEELRRTYPGLASEYPVVYSGSASNVFFEHLFRVEASDHDGGGR